MDHPKDWKKIYWNALKRKAPIDKYYAQTCVLQPLLDEVSALTDSSAWMDCQSILPIASTIFMRKLSIGCVFVPTFQSVSSQLDVSRTP